MNETLTLYRQLIYYLPKEKFKALSKKYGSDRYVKSFDTWSHFLVLLASQIKGWSSLREIETGFKSRENLIYHLGIKSLPRRSNLSKANNKRDSRVFEESFYELLSYVVKRINSRKKLKVRKELTLFDSTVITVSLELFKWATFRREGGFKIHTAYSVNKEIPVFINVTHGNISDITGVDQDIKKYTKSILVFDRGYSSTGLFFKLDTNEIEFVTRLKQDLKYEVIKDLNPKHKSGILEDQIIKFAGKIPKRQYPNPLRLVTYYDKETEKEFKFVSNNLNYAPTTIAYLYKKRWDIELFFKWIKQNLVIKQFFGTTENAVKIQVWVAMTAYVLLNYVQTQCNYEKGMLTFTRLVRELLFEDIGLLDVIHHEIISLRSKKSREDRSQASFEDLI